MRPIVEGGMSECVVHENLRRTLCVTMVGNDSHPMGRIVPVEVVFAVAAGCDPGVVDRTGIGGWLLCYCCHHEKRGSNQKLYQNRNASWQNYLLSSRLILIGEPINGQEIPAYGFTKNILRQIIKELLIVYIAS